VIYGVFGGLWAMGRFGARSTLVAGLALFALGNLLCGAATDLVTMSGAKLVEGVGKGMVIVLCRSVLYRQFGAALIIALRSHGVVAYAPGRTPPLVTACINDELSWRWIFWVNVPIAFIGLVLVSRYYPPDRPPRPLPIRIDWLAVTLLALWVVSL